jgi:hypothetical protein
LSHCDEAEGVAEFYRYSAFGEEAILNAQGQKLSNKQSLALCKQVI